MVVLGFGDVSLNSLSATVPPNDGNYGCSCALVLHRQQDSLGGAEMGSGVALQFQTRVGLLVPFPVDPEKRNTCGTGA